MLSFLGASPLRVPFPHLSVVTSLPELLRYLCFGRMDCQDLEFSWWFSCSSTSDFLLVNGLAFLSGVLQLHYNGHRYRFCLFSLVYFQAAPFFSVILKSTGVVIPRCDHWVVFEFGAHDKSLCGSMFSSFVLGLLTAMCVLRGLSCFMFPPARLQKLL